MHLPDGEPKSYDDGIVRLRLRQAFGRLIRRAIDRGVFVLLDRRCPRGCVRLPGRCGRARTGLAEAVGGTGFPTHSCVPFAGIPA